MHVNAMILVVSVIFLFSGVALLKKHAKQKKYNTEPITAEVVDYNRESRYDADTGTYVVFYPVLRYYAGGQWYVKADDTGRGKKKYGIGEEVRILVDPENPEEFNMEGDRIPLIAGIICVVVGLGMCYIAFFGK